MLNIYRLRGNGNLQGVEESQDNSSTNFFLDTLQSGSPTKELFQPAYLLAQHAIKLMRGHLLQALAVIDNVVVGQNH